MILYELGGPPLRGAGLRRYSVFAWRTRLALAHKGIAFESCAVKITDKPAIAFSGQGKVPIIRDGETVVFDSLRIAEYLEAAYSERPTLFGGETGRSLARFFNSWTDRQLIGTLFPALMLEHVGLQAPDDGAHIRGLFESALGQTLEGLAAQKAAVLAQFSRLLDPVRSALRAQPWLGGSAPRYPDFILFSVLQFARITSIDPVLPAGDPVMAWFERLLDAYDGMGRAEPARTPA
jgi:glutathione S-transferase